MLVLGFLILSVALMTLGLMEISLGLSERKKWLKVLGIITTIIGLLVLGVAIYFLFVCL